MEPHSQEPDLKPIYHRLLSPLSLFPSKAKPPPEPPKRPSQDATPLQSIPLAKLKVGPLCRQVSKRLASSGRAARVTAKDRLRLTEVILEELKCNWREPPIEPILDYENNQKLRQRLESYVLISSEQLFVRYLHLLVTLPTSRRVFTESATLSRLAVNLARDCTVFLTSPDVYRCLLADFQTLLNLKHAQGGIVKLRPPPCPPGTFKLCPIPWPHSTGLDHMPCSSLNLNYLVQLSRPYDFPSEPEPDPVEELKSIPQLKSRQQLLWVPSMIKDKEIESRPSPMVPLPSHSPSSESHQFPTSPVHSWLQRGQSMPCLHEGWSLADELCLLPPSPHPLTPLILASESKPLPFRDIVAEDLKQKMKIMRMEWSRYSLLDSGLPPLLGVLTRRLTAQHHLEKLQQMIKSLQEEEASGKWDLQPPRIIPLHPQPVTVALKVHDQVIVQVATVQLSERYFNDSFHVEGAGVLYNHLTGELDGKAIEEMDADRLVGNTTGEVYKELMSRVSVSHLSFEEGDQIEPSADKDWSSYLASSFLHQDKHMPIINRNLVGFYSRRTSTPKPVPEKVPSLTLLPRHKSWDKRPNRHGVWMNWLKPSVSSEDYFKYLSFQESDFLHVIFQMYEKEAPVEVPVPVQEYLDIQQPPPLLQDKELEFMQGKWDWSSVIEDGSGPGRAYIHNLQQRLKRLWVMLEVPEQNRLDMVIKYSSNARLQQLPALIKAWEQVLKPIQKRESLLGRLEWFEQQASDPNRFFQKPDLLMNRLLEENRFRSYLQRKLNRMESNLVSLLERIESVFGEPVTFKGRSYLKKMKQDKVEMLYWLQQQRRIRNLTQAQKTFRQSCTFTGSSSQALVAPGNTPTTH